MHGKESDPKEEKLKYTENGNLYFLSLKVTFHYWYTWIPEETHHGPRPCLWAGWLALSVVHWTAPFLFSSFNWTTFTYYWAHPLNPTLHSESIQQTNLCISFQNLAEIMEDWVCTALLPCCLGTVIFLASPQANYIIKWSLQVSFFLFSIEIQSKCNAMQRGFHFIFFLGLLFLRAIFSSLSSLSLLCRWSVDPCQLVFSSLSTTTNIDEGSFGFKDVVDIKDEVFDE